MKYDEFGGRIGDWAYFCQICGWKCWASETTVLDPYTGRGGLRVCQSCNDPIWYGIVPYKIRPEESVPFSDDTVNDANPKALWNNAKYFPFDYTNGNPLYTPPQQNSTLYLTWDQLQFYTWDQWTVPWGTGDTV